MWYTKCIGKQFKQRNTDVKICKNYKFATSFCSNLNKFIADYTAPVADILWIWFACTQWSQSIILSELMTTNTRQLMRYIIMQQPTMWQMKTLHIALDHAQSHATHCSQRHLVDKLTKPTFLILKHNHTININFIYTVFI